MPNQVMRIYKDVAGNLAKKSGQAADFINQHRMLAGAGAGGGAVAMSPILYDKTLEIGRPIYNTSRRLMGLGQTVEVDPEDVAEYREKIERERLEKLEAN